MNNLESTIKRYLPGIIAFRHAMHAYPELAYEEHETSARIESELRKIPGLEIQKGIAKTGIVATLNREKTGRCIALRADIDALPIAEKTGLEYSSTRSGLMHAADAAQGR